MALAAPAILRGASAEPKRLGIALAGLGRYATQQLAPALKLTKHCRLVGAVTGHREKGLKLAQEHGFPEKAIYSYDTMQDMADNPDIDIVYVVTPNSLHAEHVIAAAKAGKHVICEKPMAISVAEADAMIAACRAAGRKLSIGYRLHFDPYHREMMRLAKDPEKGPFKKITSEFSFVMSRKVWRAERRLAGGGPMMDVGIYCIQAGCMAVGGFTTGGGPLVAPVAVTAQELPKKRPDICTDVEETMTWAMEFANGAQFEGRSSYQASANFVRAESDRDFIEIQPAFGYAGMTARNSGGYLRFEQVNQQAAQMDDFAECVRDNKESRVSGAMGRRDMAILAAIYDAAKTGKRTLVSV